MIDQYNWPQQYKSNIVEKGFKQTNTLLRPGTVKQPTEKQSKKEYFDTVRIQQVHCDRVWNVLRKQFRIERISLKENT